MQLIKNQAIVADEWRHLDDEAPFQESPSIVSFSRFQSEKTLIIERNKPFGIRLTVNDALEDIIDDLSRFSLIALEFPIFTDGRHYSNAQLLRERYGYQGDIRATGDVLQDQLLFMRRCGFTSFEFQGRSDADVLDAFEEFTVFYQESTATVGSMNSMQANLNCLTGDTVLT